MAAPRPSHDIEIATSVRYRSVVEEEEDGMRLSPFVFSICVGLAGVAAAQQISSEAEVNGSRVKAGQRLRVIRNLRISSRSEIGRYPGSPSDPADVQSPSTGFKNQTPFSFARVLSMSSRGGTRQPEQSKR